MVYGTDRGDANNEKPGEAEKSRRGCNTQRSNLKPKPVKSERCSSYFSPTKTTVVEELLNDTQEEKFQFEGGTGDSSDMQGNVNRETEIKYSDGSSLPWCLTCTGQQTGN